jgi:hypothetical protein
VFGGWGVLGGGGGARISCKIFDLLRNTQTCSLELLRPNHMSIISNFYNHRDLEKRELVTPFFSSL